MHDSADQAIQNLTGEQFIDWLLGFIGREVQAWPELALIRTTPGKPEKIKKFLLQEFLAAEALLGSREGDPGFLRFAIANLSESDDPQAESPLEILENRRMTELLGHKIERGLILTPNRALWVRLLKALGAEDLEIEKMEPKEATRNYIAELSDVLSTGEWQTAVGAFASQDRAVAEECQALIELIKRNTQVDDKALEILTKQAVFDSTRVHTNHLLDKATFDPEAKQLLLDGVFRQLEVRREFLAGLVKYLETN